MTNYYISDFHWGHQFITTVDNCPFDTIEEQEEAIITNWNKTLKNTDTGFILGDVSYRPRDETLEMLEQLKGNIVILPGNHDRWLIHEDNIADCLTIKDTVFGEEKYVFLCHYPCAVWDRQFEGGLHLYGHVHSRMNNDGTIRHTVLDHPDMSNAYNCGCMVSYMNYTPRTIEEIILSNKHQR